MIQSGCMMGILFSSAHYISHNETAPTEIITRTYSVLRTSWVRGNEMCYFVREIAGGECSELYCVRE